MVLHPMSSLIRWLDIQSYVRMKLKILLMAFIIPLSLIKPIPINKTPADSGAGAGASFGSSLIPMVIRYESSLSSNAP